MKKIFLYSFILALNITSFLALLTVFAENPLFDWLISSTGEGFLIVAYLFSFVAFFLVKSNNEDEVSNDSYDVVERLDSTKNKPMETPSAASIAKTAHAANPTKPDSLKLTTDELVINSTVGKAAKNFIGKEALVSSATNVVVIDTHLVPIEEEGTIVIANNTKIKTSSENTTADLIEKDAKIEGDQFNEENKER